MRRHRLDRLSKLARGAAVISLGMAAAACDKEGAPKPQEPIHTNATAEPPHVNATATPQPSVAPPVAPPATLNPSSVPHTVNAPPQLQPAPKTSK